MNTKTTSSSGNGLRNSSGDRIFMIDWNLLYRRLRMRAGQFFRSARHRVAETEYTPPAWAQGFKLNWFRVGLIGLTIFVFTQKQIDFTVSVGKAGISASTPGSVAAVNNPTAGQSAATPAKMSMLPLGESTSNDNSAPAATTRTWSVEEYDVATVRAYINRFERVAQTEEEKYGVPTAAKLAIAILESGAGTSPAARENNNHFGTATSNGFYENAWANWRAHSQFMNTMYPELTHGKATAAQWVRALGKTDYSRDPQYAEKLLSIMKHFNL